MNFIFNAVKTRFILIHSYLSIYNTSTSGERMKIASDINFLPDDSIPKIPQSVSLYFWKIARREILDECLKAMEFGSFCKAFFQLTDEQIKKIQAARNMPEDLRARIFKICQQHKEISIIAVAMAAMEMLKSFEDVRHARFPWKVMLTLNALSHMTGISQEWIDDEKNIADMVEEADGETLGKCVAAMEHMSAFMDLKVFMEKVFPVFFQGYRLAINEANDDVCGNFDSFLKTQKALVKSQKIKRSFAHALLKLRKDILATPESIKAFAEATQNADYANIWNFAQALDKYAEAIMSVFREKALDSLPKPLDMRLLRDMLRCVQPALADKDLDIALRELEDIENGELNKGESQLLSNIIPAILGEKPFSIDSFDEAQDRNDNYPYSYKFIKKLACNAYHADMRTGTEDARTSEMEAVQSPNGNGGSGQSMTIEQAVELCRSLEDEQEQESADNPDEVQALTSGADTADEDAAAGSAARQEEDPEEVLEEAISISGPEKEVGSGSMPVANVSEVAKEINEKAASRESDPFELYEGSILDNAMPGNKGEDKVSESDSNLKNIGGIAVDATGEMDVEPDIRDPLERKFARLQLSQSQKDNNSGHTASSRTAVKIANQVSLSEKQAEKKSAIKAAWSKIENNESPKYDFAELLDALKNENFQTDNRKFPVDEDWNKVFKSILAQGEFAGLVWLGRSLGNDSPYPAWLLELLYLGSLLVPRGEASNASIIRLSAIATQKLDDLDEGQILLLAAAILRPILMMPDKNMATIASFLSSRLGNFALTPFFRGLEGFIQRGQPVDASIFTGESQSHILERWHETLKKDTNDFLHRLIHAKLPYQPASQLRNLLFKESGFIGENLNKCLKGNFAGLDNFISSCSEDKGIDNLIKYTTKSIPRFTKDIQAKARKSLIEDIRKAAQIAMNWREYIKACENVKEGGYSEKAFYELFVDVPEDIQRLEASMEGKILAAQINCLKACERNRLPAPAFDPETELKYWKVRSRYLFKGQEDAHSGLADEILSGNINDDNYVAASIGFQIADGRIEDCASFLGQHDSIALAVPDFERPDSAVFGANDRNVHELLDLGRKYWADKFQDEYEKVKKRIAECEFRGAIHTHETAKFLDGLKKIADKYDARGDKVKGIGEFDQILIRLQEREKAQNELIGNNIEELRTRRDLSDEAVERIETYLIPHLQSGMYNLAWADIMEIQDHLSTGEPFAEKNTGCPAGANGAHEFYSQLEAGQIRRGKDRMLPQWEDVARKICNRPPAAGLDKRVLGAITEFVRHLGFMLEKDDQPEIIHTTGKPNNWFVLRFRMEIDGRLPQWSQSNKKHIVAFGWNVTPENIDQLLSMDKMGSEFCKTIICFSPLDMAARKQLVGNCANRCVAPIVIDENLSAFLASRDKAEWNDILFHICFAGSSIIPYTDAGGAVPGEMFVGREDVIRGLCDKNGPCILYGGRQLGKSAILQRISNSHKDGLKTLMHSMDNSETSLIDAIRRECVKAGICDERATKNSLPDNIKRWLDANPDMRILVLLDECDRALDMDLKKDFDETVKLRNLMTDTQRRFKVVLTGLHSVQRFSQIHNQPFLHFGEPLCIGPLTPDAAHELMVKPMSFLGLEFANEQLVQIALNHCSYQPKLIQIFCMELLKAIGRKRSLPFHTIDTEQIQKIYASNNLKKKIVECFDMTLNLDDRYLVIGYVLALHSDTRLNLDDLLDELVYYWPAAFNPEKNNVNRGDMLNTLKSLLHEMEGLGLVTSLDNEYHLRTPGVIDLLGGLDFIYSRLEPYETKPYRPEASQDKLRVDEHGVFVASQYNLLMEKNNQFLWITGNKALGLDHVPEILAEIARKITDHEILKLSGATHHDLLRTMRESYAKLDRGGIVFLVNGEEFPFMRDFMKLAYEWFDKLHTGRKFIKIFCIIDPSTMHAFNCDDFAREFAATQMQLLPWSQEGIELAIKNENIPGLDAAEVYNNTRGWTKLVRNYLDTKGHNRATLCVADLWEGQDGPLGKQNNVSNAIADRLLLVYIH